MTGDVRRWSVALPQGRRGAGLGNEIFSLAKAHIGAAVLDAKLVEQPWWLNRRRYGHELGYNVISPSICALARLWAPRMELTREKVAYPWDYARSMEAIAATLPNSCVVLHASGMTGGYLGIRGARPFLIERLGVAPQRRLASDPLRVGIHLRAGDFTSEPVRPGVFNARLSSDWIQHAVSCIARSWSTDMSLTVYTDAGLGDGWLTDVMRGMPTGIGHDVARGGVLDDLRGLAASDVIIPSVSSYSMLALFLSDAAYLWPAHQMHHSGNWLSIWGHEPDARSGPIAQNIQRLSAAHPGERVTRGVPLRMGQQPDLTEWLRWATQRLPWGDETDLLLHGVVSATGLRY